MSFQTYGCIGETQDNETKCYPCNYGVGSADAKQQEILSGLEVGQIVISNPDSSLKDGEKVSNVTSDDTATTEESEVSE